MNKAKQVRAHLVANVAALRKHPERLSLYIERGAIAARPCSLGYEYRYELHILVTDYADHADTLIVPLLAWLAVNEPALLQNPDSAEQAIQYEAEIIDKDTADVLIKLPIREAVLVADDGAGGWTATHLDEPALPDLGGPVGFELFIGRNHDYEQIG